MFPKTFANQLKNFDAYPKTLEDFKIKTFAGATITITSGIIMAILFYSELSYYLTYEIQQELLVDYSKGQKLNINFNLTLHQIACSYLSIDAMDVAGEQQFDVSHNILKHRLNADGFLINEKPLKGEINIKNKSSESPMTTISTTTTLDPNRCESCYGAETQNKNCCNTCNEVKEAYIRKGWAFSVSSQIEQCKREYNLAEREVKEKEGCQLVGYLQVNKVGGNFHIAPGVSYSQRHVHVHDLNSLKGSKFNMSHSINHFSFGDEFPGQENPLDSTDHSTDKESTMTHYYIKIVPTIYTKINQNIIYTNQYSVTKHSKVATRQLLGSSGLPGIFFTYDLSPMMVKYTEKKRSFTHFLTGICAIIGGIFTVAGLFDSLLYHSSRAIQKKIELGKTT